MGAGPGVRPATPPNPIAAIEGMVGEIRSHVGPFTEGMADLVSNIEKMDPSARVFAARVMRPFVHEVASAVEAVAAPLRSAERKLERLAKGK